MQRTMRGRDTARRGEEPEESVEAPQFGQHEALADLKAQGAQVPPSPLRALQLPYGPTALAGAKRHYTQIDEEVEEYGIHLRCQDTTQ